MQCPKTLEECSVSKRLNWGSGGTGDDGYGDTVLVFLIELSTKPSAIACL